MPGSMIVRQDNASRSWSIFFLGLYLDIVLILTHYEHVIASWQASMITHSLHTAISSVIDEGSGAQCSFDFALELSSHHMYIQ